LFHHLLLWLLFISIYPLFKIFAAFEEGKLLGLALDKFA